MRSPADYVLPMLHYFHNGYMVRTHPIRLPGENRWQVQFYIARHEYPAPKTGKLFNFPTDTFDSEQEAHNRCLELADAIIDGKMEGYTLPIV